MSLRALLRRAWQSRYKGGDCFAALAMTDDVDMSSNKSDEQSFITLKPIGFVRNEVKQPKHEGWEQGVSEIVLDPSLTEALDNLDEFSHIVVLYWMHKEERKGESPNRIHPRGNPANPLVGLFATRSPHRPNPIGKTTVKLLERKDNILKVKGLDAIDGTPVLDIKPYIPDYDSASDAKVPPWINKPDGL